MKKPAFTIGALVILLLVGPLIYQVDPLRTKPVIQFQPPSTDHLLGTDLFGRDVLSRVLHGGRFTLLIAGLATAVAVTLGVSLGMLAVMQRFYINDLALILINALLALPGILIALVILTALGRGGLTLVIALGLSQVASIGYTTRAAILTIKMMEYVEAARNLGATQFHILIHHLLPNALPSIMAYVGVVFSYTLLNGAALTFLGVGIEPGVPEWGVMLAEGRAALRIAPWIGLAPGIGITVTVWSVNALVDKFSQFR